MSSLATTNPNFIQAHPFLFFVVFVVFFVAYWCLVTFLVSVITGWHSLARRFRFTDDFNGETWSLRSADMRFLSHYRNCLKIGADTSGLFMSVFPIFRVGHPPLLIPWSEITVIREETRILFFKRRKLLLGREEPIPLLISIPLAENLQKAAGPSWPVESPGL